MSLRTALLPVIDRIRALTGPDVLDIRITQLTIRTRTWASGKAGVGAYTDVDLVLPKIYRVDHIRAEEIASSGGRYESEDLKFGPITPKYDGGGFTPAMLKPNGAAGKEIIYILSGAVDGEYALKSVHTEKPFSYILILTRRNRTP